MNAHNDTKNPAGQIRPTEQELKGHQDLSDYIRSIKRAQALDDVALEKKLTFKEWIKPFHLSEDTKQFMQVAWDAALKHGKV